MTNFEQLLKERGLTKSAFGEMIGVKKQNINALTKNPTLETQKRIAVALGVEVWELFISRDHLPQPAHNSTTCPHCGKPIVVELHK